MRRVLVLTGFLVLAAAAAGTVFAMTRSAGSPAVASAATHRTHHRQLAVNRHRHGHRLAPIGSFGHPRMRYPLVSEGSRGRDVRRLHQLLAQRGYLPVAFHATGPRPLYELAPRTGRFRWRFTPDASLAALWRPRVFSTVTRGAVMAFQSDHGLAVDGVAGKKVWRALTAPMAPGDHVPYTYAVVRESSPETITIYRNGHSVFTSLANTGIAQAPTALGTYPVYLRYTSTTMQGTNPDGTHYYDTGVPWVSYFNGGDAVHGFLRGSYGSPQSLGCVELPYSSAQTAYGLMSYGTLVTVTT